MRVDKKTINRITYDCYYESYHVKNPNWHLMLMMNNGVWFCDDDAFRIGYATVNLIMARKERGKMVICCSDMKFIHCC